MTFLKLLRQTKRSTLNAKPFLFSALGAYPMRHFGAAAVFADKNYALFKRQMRPPPPDLAF